MSTRYCKRCGAEHANYSVGVFNQPLCNDCADKMTECDHTDALGHTETHYDDDGCGFKLWTCGACGFRCYDPLA